MSNPDFVERGHDLVNRGQFQEAVKVCRLGLLASPTNVSGRLVLARALMALRRYDDVLAEMRVALEVEFSNADALALKGEALLRKGEIPQAVEILKRAASIRPDDHAVLALQQEAELAALSGGEPARPPVDIEREVELAAMCEAETKHYPTHSGLESEPRRGRGGDVVTRPTTAAPDDFHRLTPPPEVLAVGDRSGTIEIDPDIEGIEVPGELVDAPIEPPLPVAGPGPGLPEPAPQFPRPDYPMAGRAYPPSPYGQSEPVQPVPGLPPHPPGYAGGEPFADGYEPGGFDDPELATAHYDPVEARNDMAATPEVPGYPRPSEYEPPPDYPAPARSPSNSDQVMTAAQRRVVRPRRGDLDFPDDQSTAARGKGRVEYGTSETRPETPRARPREQAPMRLDGFPEDETGVSTVELEETLHRDPLPQVGGRPSESDDMRTIRAGLGLDDSRSRDRRQEPPRGAEPLYRDPRREPREPRREAAGRREAVSRGRVSPGPSRRREPRREARRGTFAATPRRGRKLLYLYAAIALVVVGGAVYGGLKLRKIRLNRQIHAEEVRAAKHARADTFDGYVQARDAYSRIVKVKRNRTTEAALARIQAAIAAEFGEGLELAERLVNDLGVSDSADAMVARGFVALARSDSATAARLAEDVVKHHPNDAYGLYLRGRAALLARRLEVAADSFRAALQISKRPLIYVGLGLAEMGLERYDEALAAFDRALDLVPGHPAATIHRARVLARKGDLPAGDEPEASLEKLVRAGSSVAGEPVRVSPEQVAWATLALAEVALVRGQGGEARDALARAVKARPATSWAYARELILALLRAGDTRTAEAEAQRATGKWPEQSDPQVVLAMVALALDDPSRALTTLKKCGDISDNPEALLVRGRARLARGELDEAAKDLDAVIAIRPQSREALVARADVYLQNGNARVAAEQLKAIYTKDASVDMAVVYASALRRTNDRKEARRILDKYLKQPNAARAYLELARLERDEGNFREARQAYGKAIELSPNAVVARREAALLAFDTGDAQGAREAFAALMKDAPDNGRVLVEAARVYCLTGGIAEVGDLLDRAEKTSSAPRWMLARERGRAKLRTRARTEAVADLETAVKLRPDDGESRLLLLDAHLGLDDEEAARKVLQAILKRFPNRPESELALGRLNLYADRVDEAMTAFVKAKKQLAKENAPNRQMADVEKWIGRVLYYDDQLKAAQRTLRKAVKLDPSQSEAHYYLGLVELDLRQWRSAANAFEKSVEGDPTGNPDAWFYLGEASRLASRRSSARKAYEQFLEQVTSGDLAAEARRQLRDMR